MTVYASRSRRRRTWPLRAVAALAIVLLAVAGIELGGVAMRMRHDRAVLDAGQTALARQWDLTTAVVDGAPAPPAAGGPIGRLFVPRLGLDWLLVEGVTDAALAAGPGHYPGSAAPGARGNFAVAGHREVGAFADLDRVAAGDAIVVETRKAWHLYRVVSNRVVPKTALAEVDSVPPGMSAGKLLTLTTCWPRFGNSKRIIVHAVLERTTPADQPPSELAGAG